MPYLEEQDWYLEVVGAFLERVEDQTNAGTAAAVPATSRIAPIAWTSARADNRPVSCAPSSAPGIDAAPPDAISFQSGAAEGRWPTRPAIPTQTPTARVVPTARGGGPPTSRRS